MLALILFVILALIQGSYSYFAGDRISATYQSVHNGWKTAMLELPPAQMPRFGQSDTFIFNTPIPAKDSSLSDRNPKINVTSDVKVQLSFGNSLLVPWIKVYDSNNKQTLKSLTLIFSKDKYDLVRISQEKVYDSEDKLSASADMGINHPSVTSFEIIYQWRGVEDQDNAHGIFVMFLCVVIGAALLLILGSNDGTRNNIKTAGGGGRGSVNSKATSRSSKRI